MTRRIDSIDIAKGIGIILVAVGHNKAFTDSVERVHAIIYLFHMPLFFLLSGVTTPTLLGLQKLKRRLLGLFKPYLVSFLIFLPRQLSLPNHPSNDHLLLNFIWGSGSAVYNTSAWFLMSLASGYILYSAIQALRRNFGLDDHFPVFALGLIILTYLFLDEQIGFAALPHNSTGNALGAPLNADLAPLVAGILILGAWLGTRHNLIRCVSSRTLCAIIFVCIVLFGILLRSDPGLDLNYRAIQSWKSALLCGFFGIAAVIACSALIDRHASHLKRALVFLGRNTLIILLFHAPLQNIIAKPLDEMTEGSSALVVTASFFACFTLAMLSEHIINRSKHLRSIFYVK